MKLADKAWILWRLIVWRLNWARHDIDYCPKRAVSDKFVTARAAAGMIDPGDTVLSCGLASNARCSIFFWAVRNRFEETGSPAGLTWISVGAQGGRGRMPGTVEELALPGLVSRYVCGHVETAKSLLTLAAAGDLELHLMPQGEMTHVIEAQGEGRERVLSRSGLHTFLDPRTGPGSPVAGGESLVRASGDRLEFHLPAIGVALINAPYADAAGNIYFRNAAALTESIEAAAAARCNGGKVLVCVADIIEECPGEIALPADSVDAIVVNPRNEQTGGIPQRKYWDLFTPQGRGDPVAGIQKLRFVNDVLGLTPARGPAEQAVARLAASCFTREARRGSTVNLGVGYGEEVVRILCEQGLHREVTFTTETGVYGGVPAPGIYFGAAVNPERLESSAWMFHHYREALDTTLLGFLEVDTKGNVNASHRGERITDLVGPGGLPSIVAEASTILFVGGWTVGGRWRLRADGLQLLRPGAPKFVRRVRAVTFSAAAALGDGKRVFYVTNVGVFRLAPEGLMLVEVMPGIDIRRDILDVSEAQIVLPPGGEVPTVPLPVATGRGFELRWPGQKVRGTGAS